MGAIFSPCRTWRYTLWRDVGDTALGTAAFIGLNPSTADEVQNDPTIRRCMGFTREWNYGRYVMLNLFGIRSTDPKLIGRVPDPIGPENDKHILRECRRAGIVIAAWGAFPLAASRGEDVLGMLYKAGIHVHALRLTSGGHPAHPLYLPKNLEPFKWGP